jgi:hypothetical protein
MGAFGPAKRPEVGFSNVSIECLRRRSPSATERVVDDGLGRGCDESLGQGFGLRQQRPGPERQRQPRVRALPSFRDRYDVQYGDALDQRRVVAGSRSARPAAT